MKRFARIAALAATFFVAAISLSQPAGAEPLLVIFQFSQAAYSDSTGNEIVITIRRTDQDPATANEQFAVECKLAGGDAVENQDYRMSFNGSLWELGKIAFPPGVREKSFTIYTYKKGGPPKTVLFTLSNPVGSSPAVIGSHDTARVTVGILPASKG